MFLIAGVTRQLSNPGEIRREYELQLARERSERDKQREAEEKASEIIIKKILEEEKAKANSETEKIRLDQEVAKRLAYELQSKPGPSNSDKKTHVQTKKTSGVVCKNNTIDDFITNLRAKYNKDSLHNYQIPQQKLVIQKSLSGQKVVPKSHTSTILCQNRYAKNNSSVYKNLFLNKTLQREHNNSTGSDSGDSIKQEMTYFKPIKSVPKTLPKILEYGITTSAPPLQKVSIKRCKAAATVCIQKPNNKAALLGVDNRNSAFVKYSTNRIVQAVVYAKPISSNVKVMDTGKSVKQYYNKRLFNSNVVDSKQESSPLCSPLLGFEKPNENRYNNVVKSLVSSISASLNKTSKCDDNLINISKDEDLNSSSVNSSDDEMNTGIDNSKQMELDLEYARKLHEELNRPQRRGTRSQINNCTITKSSLRKRQITLDEFIASKKLKI